MRPAELLTPDEAARLKGDGRSTIYAAIAEGQLPAVPILKRLAIRRSDLLSWTPPHRGRPKGTVVTGQTRMRMSEAQKKRWKRSGR